MSGGDDFEDVGPAGSWLEDLGNPRPEEAPEEVRKRRETVGYLRGRGGRSVAGPEEAIAELRGEIREIAEGLEAILAEAERVEEAFLHVRRAFERTQPPIFKRLTVRWWRARKGERRVPCLIQVDGDGLGREKPVRRFDRRVRRRTDGGFGLNADLAGEVFEIYWALWSLRCELQDDLSRLAAIVRGRRKKLGRVDRLAYDAVRARAEATDRLRRVGFEFDPVPVPEWPLPEGFWAEDGELGRALAGKAGDEEWRGVGVEPEGDAGEG
jgi:hypothetical protein